MPTYFVKYTEDTAFVEGSLCDKNCDKNRGQHKNQYIHGTSTAIHNKNEELGEFSPIFV